MWEVTNIHQGEDGTNLAVEVQDPDGFFDANVRWDGLLELHVYHNVPKGERNPAGDGHIDTLHLANLSAFIRRLQELEAICSDLLFTGNKNSNDEDV